MRSRCQSLPRPLRTWEGWLKVEFMVKDDVTDHGMQTRSMIPPLFPLAYYDTPAHSVSVAWFRQLYNIFFIVQLG